MNWPMKHYVGPEPKLAIEKRELVIHCSLNKSPGFVQDICFLHVCLMHIPTQMKYYYLTGLLANLAPFHINVMVGRNMKEFELLASEKRELSVQSPARFEVETHRKHKRFK